MSDLLQIAGVPEKRPKRPPTHDDTANYQPLCNDVCARPGYDIITHCIEPKGHEGQHTYAPVPDGRCQCGRKWTRA